MRHFSRLLQRERRRRGSRRDSTILPGRETLGTAIDPVMAFRAVLGSQQLLRRRPTLLLPTRVPPTARRPIASNAVAPAFGYQNQLDLSADVREEEAESQSGKGGGGPSSGGQGGGGGGGGPKPPRGPAWDSAIATAGGQSKVLHVPSAATEASPTWRGDTGIILLTGAGLCYHYWYKWEVQRKMARAFAKGYDPVLELAQATAKESDGTPRKGIIRRKEQDYVDKVINGEISGECKDTLVWAFSRCSLSY